MNRYRTLAYMNGVLNVQMIVDCSFLRKLTTTPASLFVSGAHLAERRWKMLASPSRQLPGAWTLV